MTHDLAAFLTARLDEEERVAKLAAEIMVLRPTSAPFGFRLLADIDAKRRIVTLHNSIKWDRDGEDVSCRHCDKEWPCPTLRLLALPYADHPDYDQAWRP